MTDSLTQLIAYRIPAAPKAPVYGYGECPDYAGQWWHKSTGACSCGQAHSDLDERRTAARLASQERVNTLGFPRSS